MMLAIMKNSFHYKYYLLLRKMWNLKESLEKPQSLCLYSHFIFWMTLATVVTSPLILIGWLILKFCRFLYKICSWTKIGQSFTDILDEIFGIGVYIEESSKKMEEAPVAHLIDTTFIMVASLIPFIFAIVLFTLGITAILTYFMNIPEFLLGMLYCLSLWFFYICCGIGWLTCKMLLFIAFCFKYIVIGITSYAGIALLILCIFSVISFIMIMFVKIMLSIKYIRDFLGFKINGFNKAREDALKRRIDSAEIKKIAYAERENIKLKKKNGEIPFTFFERMLSWIYNNICKFFCSIKGMFFEKTSKVKGRYVTIIGSLGLIWETIKSIKSGVCPFIEFIDEKDLEENNS